MSARSMRSACPNSPSTAAIDFRPIAMFNGEQRARVPDEDRRSLALILVALLDIYAGLSTAVVGFVLDITELVIAGLVLVCCASLPISRVAKRRANSKGFTSRRPAR